MIRESAAIMPLLTLNVSFRLPPFRFSNLVKAKTPAPPMLPGIASRDVPSGPRVHGHGTRKPGSVAAAIDVACDGARAGQYESVLTGPASKVGEGNGAVDGAGIRPGQGPGVGRVGTDQQGAQARLRPIIIT